MDNKILKSANEYYKKNNIPTTTIDENIYLELDNDQFQLSENEIKFRARINDKENDYLKFMKEFKKNNN
tara:strand:+ start:200 stop:406 length:207 start_codon:yes stop_codon:yes gene_type:complete